MAVETLHQQMAVKAFDNVNAHLAQFPTDSKGDETARTKYGTMAHKLPILIHTAGLAQAVAFVQSRGSEEQKLLLDHVAATLLLSMVTNGEQLATRSREAELPEYMLLSRRTLAALLWYKRFAESVLRVSQRDQGEEEITATAEVNDG